jgi:hypothetical protein
MFNALTNSNKVPAQGTEALYHALSRGEHKIDDVYSLGLLQPLMTGYPFLPFTGSAMRPFCIAHLLNDIVINNRKNIIEFGSGISTIMTGRLIRKNNLTTTLLSVEHDKNWAIVLEGILKNEDLQDVVKVLHVPLTDCKLVADNDQWYDIDMLSQHIEGRQFDMVIVDGPPAWVKGKEKARYPALPFIQSKLASRFSIYLDDANRQGEQVILKLWQALYSFEFAITGGTLGYYYRGDSFYTEPVNFF